jgi:D-3-phosphoglycerate dehydrogenase
MPRVLVTPTHFRRRPWPFADELRAAGFQVAFPEGDLPLSRSDEVARHLEGIDAVIASTEPLTREVLAGSRLRVAARAGVGFDSVDLAAATDLGIVVTITPGALEESVAEHTIALMLGVTRGLIERDREVRGGTWSRKSLPRLAGKTLGIVGLGRTGKAVVPRAQGLGMTVVAHDPFADAAFAREHRVELCSLEHLLARADVVSLHSPCTPETTHLINAGTLGIMKPGSILVNMSRGGLVDEAALCRALASGHLFGAGLDVFQTEPLPTDSPLLKLPNVVVTTHTGGLDQDSERAMSLAAARCIIALYQGKWPDGCVVNGELREKWKW